MGLQENARQLLVKWANAQEHWIRAIVAELFATRQPLSTASIDRVYDLLLREKRLTNGDAPTIGLLEGAGTESPLEEALVLTKLSDVKNVNALAPKQDIDFNPNLTVFFGENGAGKSGYVRILKTIASVRNAEPILPNVRKPREGAPSASLAYRLGKQAETTIEWKGEQGLRPLNRLDVFDSRGLVSHVDEQLTYVYTPGDLALFRLASESLDATRKKLDDERTQRAPKTNPFVERFSKDVSFFAEIVGLSAKSKLSGLETISNVTAEEETTLAGLRTNIADLQGGGTADKLRLVRGELALYRRVASALDILDRFDADGYAAELSTRAAAKELQDQEAKEALRSAEIPGVLGENWRAFIDAAEKYAQEIHGAAYPEKDDACLYCRQPLSEAATSLLKTYRVISTRAGSIEAGVAKRKAKDASKEIFEFGALRLREDLQEHGRTSPKAVPGDLLRLATEFMAQFGILNGQIVSLQAPTAVEATKSAAEQVREGLKTHVQSLEESEKTLSIDGDDRTKKIAELLPQKRELEARMMLRDLLPEIRLHVAALQWVETAGEVSKRIQSVSRSLTETLKIASETLVNADFEDCFKRECTALKAPSVMLDFPGKKGQPARRKRMTAEYRLSEVLSEGEQKVIGLADFLAEVSLRQAPSPLVFDDPVTSLDYKRLDHVVQRIVELGRTRQVIVFTHNIWFTMRLLEAYDKDKSSITYYDISENGEVRGIVSRGMSPRLDTWGDKKKRIEELIRRAKGESDHEMRSMFIEKGYEELRGACEVVVEQNLLQKVVQSYRRNVMVGNLKAINFADLPGAAVELNEVFEKACGIIASHKQPSEVLSFRPTVQGLEADWNRLVSIHSRFKSQ